MTANTDKLLSILTGILITVLVYFFAFWFHLALAKFILVPMFGTAICSTLNQLFNTASFNAALYICLGLPDRRHLLLASYQQQ